jgi:hypothetical protein
MWLDEFFEDMKGHGVDLEKTRLCHFHRLSRLVFMAVLFYLWLVTRGSQTIKRGFRHLVDRRDRRDRSIFRIGWDFRLAPCPQQALHDPSEPLLLKV